jgi:hypothetical protein
VSDNDRREGAVLTTFRTANDQERVRILRLKLENLQLSIRSAKSALAQVERQADELTSYMDVLESDPQAENLSSEDSARIARALWYYLRQAPMGMLGEEDDLARLLTRFSARLPRA